MLTEKNKNIESPYLAARREWNERYGDFIVAARTWRLATFLSFAVSLILAAGSIYLASQSVLVPYIVELDHTGKPAQVTLAGQELTERQQDLVIRSQLAQFIKDVREVSRDVELQNLAIKRTYAFLSRQHPSFFAVLEFQKKNLHGRDSLAAKGLSVMVEISQILKLSQGSWRVEWLEYRKAAQGPSVEPIRMVAVLTVQIGGEVHEETLLLNPLGLYVLDFTWSRDLIGDGDA